MGRYSREPMPRHQRAERWVRESYRVNEPVASMDLAALTDTALARLETARSMDHDCNRFIFSAELVRYPTTRYTIVEGRPLLFSATREQVAEEIRRVLASEQTATLLLSYTFEFFKVAHEGISDGAA